MVLASNHEWGDKFRNGFEGFFDFLPNLIGFLAVLIVGYLVARIVASALARLLGRAGLDRSLTQGQGGRVVSKITRRPSYLLGRVAFWALFLGVIALAVSVLGIGALTAFVGAILAYVPNIIAALFIFLAAGAIAAGIGALVARTMGDTTTGKLVATIAPILIMAIAGFMILDQLKIAEDIVRITYMALMGGLALALALAFGLGGRDVAARMLADAYATGQESRESVRRDLEQGRERARADFERAKEAAQERTEDEEVSGVPRRADYATPTASAGRGGSGVHGGRTGTGITPRGSGGTADYDRGATSRDVGEADKIEIVRADELDDVPPGTADPERRSGRPHQ